MLCEYVVSEKGYTCKICGHNTQYAELQRNCPEQEQIEFEFDKPSFWDRGINFTKAITNHAMDGWQKASKEEIGARLDVCRDCPLFQRTGDDPDSGFCAHKSCGCNIKNTQVFWNKLAWASEKCPLGKWGPIE